MYRKRNYLVLQYLLFVSALLAFAASILTSKYIVGDNLGLFSGLSSLFYVSVAVLVIIVVIDLVNDRITNLTGFCIVLTQVFFASAGFLIGGPGASQPNYVGSVGYLLASKYTLLNGLTSIIPFSPQYGGWPNGVLLTGMFVSVSGTMGRSLIAPLLVGWQIWLSILDTLLILSIARRHFGRSDIRPYAAALIFALGGHFVPNVANDIGISYTLALVAILLLVGERRATFRLRDTLVMSMLFIGIIISNLYASFIMLAVVIVHSLWVKRPDYAVLYAIELAAWGALGFPSIYQGLASYFISSILSVHTLTGVLESAATIGSKAHHLIILVQLAYYGLFAGCAFAATFLRIGGSNVSLRGNIRLAAFVAAIAIATLVSGPAFGTNPIESLERAYFISFVFFVLMIGSRAKRPILFSLALLALVSPVNIVAIYGPVVPTYQSMSTQYSGLFLQDHSSRGTFATLVPTFYNKAPAINIFYFTNPTFALRSTYVPLDLKGLTSQLSQHSPLVYSIGVQTKLNFLSFTNSIANYTYAVNELDAKGALVYSNPDISIYYE